VETALILAGVACIIGAIIGGGVKFVQIELSPVNSRPRQLLLGAFGLVLVISGLIAGGKLPILGKREMPAAQPNSARNSETPSAEQQQQTSNGSAQIEKKPKTPAAEIPSQAVNAETSTSRAQADASPSPLSPASLPSKVDIFWCVTDDGGAVNENAAQLIMSGLGATKQIARLRVRPLAQATNAKPDYRIFRNIVRYDPGELSAAEQIARLATHSSGITVEPAPALPGSPTIDYLSVFVCAPR
jgi:hypothetical protein